MRREVIQALPSHPRIVICLGVRWLVGIGKNGEGDQTEAKRDVDGALHIGLASIGFHFRDDK